MEMESSSRIEEPHDRSAKAASSAGRRRGALIEKQVYADCLVEVRDPQPYPQAVSTTYFASPKECLECAVRQRVPAA